MERRTVVILAGGKGTRLARISGDLPKPMVPLLGKPVLEYLVELCALYSFTDIHLLVGHRREVIMEHFGNGSRWGVNIRYFEETQPLGTSGGIAALRRELNAPFLVLYGDVLAKMDLERLWNFHRKQGADATLVLHPNDHPVDSDLVEVDADERVIAFHSKPHDPNRFYHNMVNAAAYVLGPGLLEEIPDGFGDFGKDVFPKAVGRKKIMGYTTSEYLKDMGTPDRWEKVEADLASGKVERRWYAHKQKAVFLDRDGVINPDNDLIHREEDFELYPFTGESIRRINGSDYLSIVVTNQSVVARNLTDEAGVRRIHAKMEHRLGEAGAFVDAIYYCPHHPDKGYPGENPAYKVDCNCRKPKPGMLLKAAEKYNLDLSQCIIIGDSERDIVAGKTVGCTTIGVKTGKGLRSAKVLPDYFCANLREAVDLIFHPGYEEVFAKVNRRRKDGPLPFVLSISGNTRSGKSTLAAWMERKWKDLGKTVLRVELDHWILPKEERKEEIDVYHNFQLPKLEQDLRKLLAGEEVVAPGYARHPQREAEPKRYRYAGEEVVILDGIVALGSDEIKKMTSLSLFLDLPEELLRERVTEFYRWKDFSETEINELYRRRKQTEYDLIARHKELADLVIPAFRAREMA